MTNLETLSDADLNRQFARAFLDSPIDERNNTYWRDDDTTPAEENAEWVPIPDYCNDWSAVRKILVKSTLVVPVEPKESNRCRRAMVALLSVCEHGTPRGFLCSKCKDASPRRSNAGDKPADRPLNA